MAEKITSPDREQTIFSQALELTVAGERVAFLKGACGEDAALRRRIEALLRAHGGAEDFLPERPGPQAQLPTTPWIAPTAGGAALYDRVTEKPGDDVGSYKLLQEIGEGGCGVVYMAQQEAPLRRRVALKVVKLGMDTKQVIARFEAERQALALMDHPNIAKVLDAGATQTGRPYFVMELVRGIKMTEYCDRNQLPPHDRLSLFVKVCHAIQHAHQKGVIHRDIKPSNILVTLHDGVPVPKVIDFGIAKATEGRLTDQTLFTAFEQFIGTPAYVSPEQAEMSGLDIDTRSDIYSLGVLLYEVLTGRTPFDAQELLEGGLDGLRRTIREREPLRPSTRLSTLLEGELATTAKLRGSEAVKLIHLLRGDLDWVVMKCLEKDRARRYETANGLAADIQRHLNNEPVVARPPSAAYRFQKLVRRNKLAFVAVAGVASALLLGTGVSAWQAAQALRARDQAKASEERAQHAADRERSQRQRADEQSRLVRQSLYASEMNLALQALESGNLGFALDLLNHYYPEPALEDVRGWEWRYLWAQTRSDALVELGSHSNSVNHAVFSPNGDLLATSSADATVKLWDVGAHREVAVLSHAGAVVTAVFSADGRQLATACADGNLYSWDVTSHRELARVSVGVIDPPTGHACCFSSDGLLLAIEDHEGGVNMWDVPRRTKIAKLNTESSFRCLAFSQNGKLLAGGSSIEKLVRVWSVNERQPTHSLSTHSSPVVSLAFSLDGKKLAVGSADGTLELFDLAERHIAKTLLGHTAWVPAMSFADNDKRLVSAGTDQSMILWNLETGVSNALRGHLNEVWALALSPDGRLAATGTKVDGRVSLWNATPRPKERTSQIIDAHSRDSTSAEFAFDGTALLRRDDIRRIYEVWDTATLTKSAELSYDLDPAKHSRGHACLSPHGKWIAIENGDGLISVLELNTRHENVRFTAPDKDVRWLGFSPDGQRLAVAFGDQSIRIIRIWDFTLKSWKGGFSPASRGFPISFSADGMTIGIGHDADNSAEIFEVASGQRLALLQGHKAPVSDVLLLPGGKTVATASFDQTVKLWDFETQRELMTLRGEALAVFVLAVSPDGRRLASGGSEGTIRLWDSSTGRLTAMFKGPPGDPCIGLSFTSDGDTLASVTRTTLKLWRAPSLTEIDQAEKAKRARR